MLITPLDDWIRSKTGAKDMSSLRGHQMVKFRETLDYVKNNSRFYRTYLSHVKPDSIKSLDDVSSLPFTTAEMLSEDPLGFVCVSPSDINRIVTLPTSGTTGKPKRIFFTNEDQELTIDFFHHGMSTLASKGDKVIIFLPGETEGGVGDLLKRGLERLGCETVIFGPIYDYANALHALATSGCTCAVGLPSQLFALSRLGDGIKLKSVLLCSDYVSEASRRALTSEWGCDVFSHYGMTETGLGGGVECSAHDGYHMREADLLFEIIDPVTGSPVASGEYGELVFTTLTRRGMPLIRYRTGDKSREIPEPCPCGSMLRRFERVSGRMSDTVAIGHELELAMPLLDEVVLGIEGVIGYSADVEAQARNDTLVLTIYAKHTKSGDMALGAARERIERDPYLGKLLAGGAERLEIRHGGAEILTYGNVKRRINIKK